MKPYKKYIKKQKTYEFTSYAEKFPIQKMRKVTLAELARITDRYLGVGSVKSRAVVEIMMKVFQEAFDTGRPVPIAEGVIATPYAFTEDVRPIELNAKIMQVIPQHIEYVLDSQRGSVGCYPKPDKKYYIRRTSREIDPTTIQQMFRLKDKESKHEQE